MLLVRDASGLVPNRQFTHPNWSGKGKSTATLDSRLDPLSGLTVVARKGSAALGNRSVDGSLLCDRELWTTKGGLFW